MDAQPMAQENTPAMRRRYRRAEFWRKLRWHIKLWVMGGGRYAMYASWLHKRGKCMWKVLPLRQDPFVMIERCDWCGNHRETHDNKARFEASYVNDDGILKLREVVNLAARSQGKEG